MSGTDEKTKQARPRRARTGLVTSTGGDKTIRVAVDSLVKHPRYGKYIRRRTKLAVHDPKNTAQLGDMVEIVPSRRLSKSKAWRLVRVVRPATIETRASVEKG